MLTMVVALYRRYRHARPYIGSIHSAVAEESADRRASCHAVGPAAAQPMSAYTRTHVVHLVSSTVLFGTGLGTHFHVDEPSQRPCRRHPNAARITARRLCSNSGNHHPAVDWAMADATVGFRSTRRGYDSDRLYLVAGACGFRSLPCNCV